MFIALIQLVISGDIYALLCSATIDSLCSHLLVFCCLFAWCSSTQLNEHSSEFESVFQGENRNATNSYATIYIIVYSLKQQH